jgi:hypothetical protein
VRAGVHRLLPSAGTVGLVYIGMPPTIASALADQLADSLADQVTAEIIPDGSNEDGGITLQLPESYEYCRHVVRPTSINPDHDDVVRGPLGIGVLYVKYTPQYGYTLDTQRMRVWWKLTPQPDNTRSWLDLDTLLVGVRHDLVDWARQSGYCTPLP